MGICMGKSHKDDLFVKKYKTMSQIRREKEVGLQMHYLNESSN